jgi:hypothetical protein
MLNRQVLLLLVTLGNYHSIPLQQGISASNIYLFVQIGSIRVYAIRRIF